MQKKIFKVCALISGRVQGVGFRYFTLKIAQRMNVCGFVKNLYDGRVEIESYGDKDLLMNFLDKIREGPSVSIVNNIETQWFEIDEIPIDEFIIKY